MSDLVGNPEDRFSRVAAHLFLTIIYLIFSKMELDALPIEFLKFLFCSPLLQLINNLHDTKTREKKATD